MPAEVKSLQTFKGLVANYQRLAQPQGIVSRLSNLWFAIRGALSTIPGSFIISSLNGAGPSPSNQGPWRYFVSFFPSFATAGKLLGLANVIAGNQYNLIDVTGASYSGSVWSLTPIAFYFAEPAGTPPYSFTKRPAVLTGTPQPTPQLVPFNDKLIITMSDSIPPYLYDGSPAPPLPVLQSTAVPPPLPSPPVVLPPATYYVVIMYAGYESPSPENSQAIAGGNYLLVKSPPLPPSPLQSSGYDVYVSCNAAMGGGSGFEQKQNDTPIPFGTDYTQGTLPLIGTGRAFPGQMLNRFDSGAAYGRWQANTTFIQGTIIAVNISGTTFLFQALATGLSGEPNPPTWPPGHNATVTDGQIGWKNLGASVTKPPGAAFAFNHAGFLWLWGVSPNYGLDGITGPDALWQSSLGNPQKYDPAFTSFVGKGNGETAQGGAVFTLGEVGIAATNQLVLFKDRSTYSVFGTFSGSFISIVQCPGGLGCVAPDTIQFIEGLGIFRLSYKGVALFDGQNDIVDTYTNPIRAYIFGDTSSQPNIAPIDWNNIQLGQSGQIANPDCYVMALPVNGTVTRVFVYDIDQEVWAVADLPWPITAMAFIPALQTAPTIIGHANDGTVRRVFFTGDPDWDGTPIQWSFRPAEFGKAATPIYLKRVNVRGEASSTATPGGSFGAATLNGTTVQGLNISRSLLPPKQLTGPLGIRQKLLSINMDLSGSGQVVIEGLEYQFWPKPSTRVGA